MVLNNLWLTIIISYQAITGNNNVLFGSFFKFSIISYQAITGNNNNVNSFF